MPFDFFNTSMLAFGAKITQAFTQLNNMKDNAIDNIASVLEDQLIFSEYLNRNYRVPAPIRPQSACRVDELFELIDQDVRFDKIYFDTSDNKFKVRIVIFDPKTNRITDANGETDIKKGFAFVIPAVSNKNTSRSIRFSEENDKKSTESLLFEYEIDDNGYVTFIGDISNLRVYPVDFTHYKELAIGSSIPVDSKYTSEGYECICIVGKPNNISVKLNGDLIFSGNGNLCVRHLILYLKPDDEVEMTADKAFKINYLR